MKFDFMFYLEKVSYSSKTPSTLIFSGDCSRADGRILKLKYTGADLTNETDISIPSAALKDLKEQLNDKFGYGPYNSKSVKSILNNVMGFLVNIKVRYL